MEALTCLPAIGLFTGLRQGGSLSDFVLTPSFCPFLIFFSPLCFFCLFLSFPGIIKAPFHTWLLLAALHTGVGSDVKGTPSPCLEIFFIGQFEVFVCLLLAISSPPPPLAAKLIGPRTGRQFFKNGEGVSLMGGSGTAFLPRT